MIQEKPLYEALTPGRLRGYAADVWWTYGFGRPFQRARVHAWRFTSFRM
ncbi:hypothetical protein [Bradyrhizobium sp. sBnM-33]|nr:hypothetical protein [Bradyrhizobium sp. sBnM-33]WOH52446.1 hypothetical protein RX328_09830 [Bradyrhizobium sp. sBnM-33]